MLVPVIGNSPLIPAFAGDMFITLGQFLQLVSLRAVILRLFGSDVTPGALECVLPEVLIGEKSTYSVC